MSTTLQGRVRQIITVFSPLIVLGIGSFPIRWMIAAIILVAENMTTLAVILSILLPQERLWPPNEQRTWGKPLMLVLFSSTAAGIILLGILDWNSSLIPSWARIAIGLPAWLAGNFFATWAMLSLGLLRTSGEAGVLMQDGPYRLSRNPQYLGFMLSLSGWAVLTNSALTMIAVIGAFPPLLLVPFAEEPWLRAKHGPRFDKYMRDVPRFIPKIR